MSSTFGSFNIAVSALRYNQTAMDVASTNIANADVDGYTRRLVVGETQVVGGMPRLWSRGEQYGAGVQVGSVQRTFDALLEARWRGETARLSADQVRSDVLGSVEGSLGEPGDTGLQASLTAFWDSWSGLASSPADPSARQQVLSNATAVVTGLHRVAGTIDTEWSGQHEALTTTVGTANQQAAQLAELNHEIRVATASDVDVNGLLDRRDKLVGSLAQLTGGTASLSSDGMASVTVGGQLLVDGQTAYAIDVSGATTIGAQAADPVTLAINGTQITPNSGTIGGQLEAVSTLLPDQLASLDSVAQQLASQVNTLHHTGYDAGGTAGQDVFTGTTAATISVALTSPDQVAAAGAPGTSDGSVAAAIAALASAAGGPDAVYRSFVSGISTATDLANRTADNQAVLVQSVETARSSVGGVNIDEEMVGLLAGQRGYEAASRVLTTLDSVLDTLINHTGVG